jgi:galactokinase
MYTVNTLQSSICALYPEHSERALDRYVRLGRWHRDAFGKPADAFVSAPGRTELGGNHTDHNRGCVLASAVDLDVVSAVRLMTDDVVTILSEGYPEPVQVDLRDLAPRTSERLTSAALVRGVAARLRARGHRIGGFHAVVMSDVGVGSGLSSSAAFEVMVGGVFNALYNDSAIPAGQLALAAQEAENEYFGKPCGLMDQLCAATGGALRIDFRDPAAPLVTSVRFEPESHGYALLVVNTGGSHADLTADYAAIPEEMRAVARALGGETCRDVTRAALLENLAFVRTTCGDRAALRCLHFIEENSRVEAMAVALEGKRFQEFLQLVRGSGESSITLLQNGHSPSHPARQGIMVALALSDRAIPGGGRTVSRVHGGGFAGAIQAYVPEESVDLYRAAMAGWFGPDAVTRLRVRTTGVHAFAVPQD